MGAKTQTFVGALIAALILFVSNIMTLFQQDPELTFGAISQAAWVSVIGGALVAFFKDYQALSTRRLIGKVTGNGDQTE